jgi:predicted secreted hydrolase
MNERRRRLSASRTARRHGTRTVVIVGALATLAIGIPSSSAAVFRQAGTVSAVSPPPGPTAKPEFPAFVQLPRDQAAHPGVGVEWWYTVGHIASGRHEYGYEVQLVAGGMAQIGFTDITAGKYASQQHIYAADRVSVSSTALDVRMPAASLSGPLSGMHLTADLPHGMGTLDLTLKAAGPTLYANGTGLFPFLGGTSYYYSVPKVKTSGTLTLHGRSAPVTGTSWLDRQWGNWDWSKLHKWTWMAVQLNNGQVLNLWDLFDTAGETHWATVLSPDGSERVVSVNPLASHATHFKTSPVTGQRYAGKWIVRIRSLEANLTVTAKPVLQEINNGPSFTPGIDEAASSVRGTYLGRPVAGQAYVEQFGIWK